MTTIGAGGGSIAKIDKTGFLEIGPEFRIDPGPVCYGLGNIRPTVTDANLVLAGLIQEIPLVGNRTNLIPVLQ